MTQKINNIENKTKRKLNIIEWIVHSFPVSNKFIIQNNYVLPLEVIHTGQCLPPLCNPSPHIHTSSCLNPSTSLPLYTPRGAKPPLTHRLFRQSNILPDWFRFQQHKRPYSLANRFQAHITSPNITAFPPHFYRLWPIYHRGTCYPSLGL